MAFFSNGEDREKLSILYILKSAGFPLSREQAATVMFELGYENYIRLSEQLIELEGNACIATIPTYRIQTLVLTRRGEEIISLFQENLPRSHRDAIERCIVANADAFRRDNTSQMESRFHSDGSFSTALSLVEDGEPFFEIKIKLPSAKYTRIAERRWSEINRELYFSTLLALTSEEAASDGEPSPGLSNETAPDQK